MDYKELVEMCRYLSDTPSYTAFHDKVEREIVCDSCKGELCYEKVKDAHWCMYEALQRAATAITDLMAENAALRKMQPVRLDDTGTKAAALAAEVSVLRQKLAAAEAQAEKAERERDECKAKYCEEEPCVFCIHYEEKDCDGDCLSCTADCPCNKCEEYSMWEWNGRKEE